jgi:hypothetical protein
MGGKWHKASLSSGRRDLTTVRAASRTAQRVEDVMGRVPPKLIARA